jgi:hypothetical protein
MWPLEHWQGRTEVERVPLIHVSIQILEYDVTLLDPVLLMSKSIPRIDTGIRDDADPKL